MTDSQGREWDVFAVPRMENVCLVCEAPIEQPERIGRRRVYCSQDCAHAASGARKLIERRRGWW